MVTVGFREIYRYGGKFFGYFLVVGALAAVFLGGGAYLASQEMTLTDPSLSALSETRAFVGVIAMSIGAVLGTIGFFGLAHKLMTDSMERAIASREAELTVESGAGSTATTDDRATADGDAEPDPEREPERDREPEPAAVGRHPDEAPEPVDEPAGAGQPTPPEPVDEPVAGASATESAGAAGSTEPATRDAVDADPEPGEEPPLDEGASDPPTAEDSPQEWTPPDPSEFERPSETEPEPDREPDAGQPAPEPDDGAGVDPDEVPDDETTADQGVDSFQAGGEDDPLTDRLPSSEDE